MQHGRINKCLMNEYVNEHKTQGLPSSLFSADYTVISVITDHAGFKGPRGLKFQKAVTCIFVIFDMLILWKWINYKCYFKGLSFLS